MSTKVSSTKDYLMMRCQRTSPTLARWWRKTRLLIQPPQKEKVAQKEKKTPRTRKRNPRLSSTTKIDGEATGRWRRIKSIIGSWKFTANTLFANKWEGSIRSLRQWPSSSGLEKLSNAEATIRRWKKNISHLPAFCCTSGNITMEQKTQAQSSRIW